MGDCLAVVNLVEASRMDYNFDLTELAINPTLLCFFFFFLVFVFVLFFLFLLRERLLFVFSPVLGDQRFWELPRVGEGGGFFFLTLVGWVFGRGCLEFLGKSLKTRNSTCKWPQIAKEFAFFNLAVPFGFAWPLNGFHVGTNISKVLASSVMLFLLLFFVYSTFFYR